MMNKTEILEILRPFRWASKQAETYLNVNGNGHPRISSKNRRSNDFTSISVELSHEEDADILKELGAPPRKLGAARSRATLSLDSLNINDWIKLNKLIEELEQEK